MPWDDAVTSALVSDTGGARLPDQALGPAWEEAAPLQYECRGAGVVAAHGSYDMDSITRLTAALEAASRTYPKVILDASGVTFADSTFLNLLIHAHRAATLRVVAPSPQVRRLCEITGVDGFLEVRATVDEAAIS